MPRRAGPHPQLGPLRPRLMQRGRDLRAGAVGRDVGVPGLAGDDHGRLYSRRFMGLPTLTSPTLPVPRQVNTAFWPANEDAAVRVRHTAVQTACHDAHGTALNRIRALPSPLGVNGYQPRTQHRQRALSRPGTSPTDRVVLARQHAVGRMQRPTYKPSDVHRPGDRPSNPQPSWSGLRRSSGPCLAPRSTLLRCPNVGRASTGSAVRSPSHADVRA